ncbi:hypothetical protein Amal_01947 [Acetobacter malorum]|uniref:Uncharacterized protein n=1 Tax=Acetobacter malorum TaxID=178901 RepID=A0A177G8M7_9PROT|nr:hypothetical protein Amal_01947 [Acetobacter malorum]
MAEVAAQRQVDGAAVIERDVFQRVCPVDTVPLVPQAGPVFRPAGDGVIRHRAKPGSGPGIGVEHAPRPLMHEGGRQRLEFQRLRLAVGFRSAGEGRQQHIIPESTARRGLGNGGICSGGRRLGFGRLAHHV